MDLHVATNQIIALNKRLGILEDRVHHMDKMNLLVSIVSAAISGGLVNWIF